MSDDFTKCSNCGQPKASSKPGRLTQWLSVCQCSAPLDESIVDERVSICSVCEKRIDSGRSGSLTQWVFRSETCQCKHPVAVIASSYGSEQVDPAVNSFEPFSQTNEPLELDTSRFPIERYKPLERIGAGGSGAVYRCWDDHLQMNVAVKVLLDAHPSMQVMFQNEAKVTAKLQHPNIVRIIDFGSIANTPYMVLEYVAGINLSAFLETHGPLDVNSFIELFVQVADALDNGHKAGIFHRDVKSSNILLKGDADNVKPHIIDFGVAAWTRGSQSATIQGMTLVGTPQYMPPDQALGSIFDARSEIYSLGCVMFEALAGRLPFEGDDPLTLISLHATEPAPLLSHICPHVPVSLSDLVARCLEKIPEDRYQSMAELRSALFELEKETRAANEESEQNASPAVASEPPSIPAGLVFVIAVLLAGIIASGTLLFAPVAQRNDPAHYKKPPHILKRELAVWNEDLDEAAYGEKFKLTQRSGVKGMHAVANSNVGDTDLAIISTRRDITSMRLKGGISKRGLEEIVSLPLDSIDLSNCELDDDDLRIVGRMKGLVTLSLSGCREITAKGLQNLGGLKLTTLVLRNTTTDDDGAEAISRIPTIMQLMISDTNVTAAGIKSLGKLRSLNALEVDPDDKPLDFFKAVAQTKATHIVLNSTISMPIPPENLVNIGRPENLTLEHTRISSETIQALAKLPSVKGLHIKSTNITDGVMEETGHLPLMKLTIEHEPVTEPGAIRLLESTRVKKIIFQNCNKINSNSIAQFKILHPDVSIN